MSGDNPRHEIFFLSIFYSLFFNLFYLYIYTYMFSFTSIIYCILIIYLFLFHTHNYMNCYESAQVCPATTILGYTLVTLCNMSRYKGAQIHPVFCTGAQRVH